MGYTKSIAGPHRLSLIGDVALSPGDGIAEERGRASLGVGVQADRFMYCKPYWEACKIGID